MALFYLTQVTSGTTIGTPCWDIKTTSATRPILLELTFSITTATNCLIGLGRSPTVSTQTSPVAVVPEDPAESTGQSTCAVAWSVAPTLPPQFSRRVYTQATIGCGHIITFPRGYVIDTSSSVVLWNITTGAAMAVSVTIDE
jgi:hypothetical protein